MTKRTHHTTRGRPPTHPGPCHVILGQINTKSCIRRKPRGVQAAEAVLGRPATGQAQFGRTGPFGRTAPSWKPTPGSQFWPWEARSADPLVRANWGVRPNRPVRPNRLPSPEIPGGTPLASLAATLPQPPRTPINRGSLSLVNTHQAKELISTFILVELG
jgi:hypothetical protein